jgi:hypothetical protein
MKANTIITGGKLNGPTETNQHAEGQPLRCLEESATLLHGGLDTSRQVTSKGNECIAKGENRCYLQFSGCRKTALGLESRPNLCFHLSFCYQDEKIQLVSYRFGEGDQDIRYERDSLLCSYINDKYKKKNVLYSLYL